MMAAQTREAFPKEMMVLSVVGLYALSIIQGMKWLSRTLGDTDDALRLVQLRQFIHGAGWYNLHIDRLNPPEGYTSHWSRLPDAVMALIYGMVRPFTSGEFAELVARIIYPGLWLVPATIAITLITFYISPRRFAVPLVMFALATNFISYSQFQAGRIDHHDAMIALSVVAIVAAAFSARKWQAAILSGAAGGLLMTIGFEGMAFVILAAAAIALRYAWLGDDPRPLKGFCAALGLVLLAGLAITVPPARWTETACDALAFNFVAPIAAGCTLMFLWASVPRLNASFYRRSIGVIVSGLVAAVLFLKIDPSCLHGPFAHVNPAVKPIWLDRVSEMRPVFVLDSWATTLDNMQIAAFVIPALIGALWLLKTADYRHSHEFIVILSAFILSVLLGFSALRMITYAAWFATPVLCLSALQLLERLGERKKILAGFLILALSPIAVTAAIGKGADLMKGANAGEKPETIINKDKCFETANYTALGLEPEGHVLAELDLGPYILALTPHSVASAPYHRISDSILEDIAFFSTDTAVQAQEIVKSKKINYIVICNTANAAQKAKSSPALYQALISDAPPSWLEPLPKEMGNPIQVYRVKN
jgi:hypothetical protein